MKHRLNIDFKGERDYLQGPDIFNATLGYLVEKQVCDEVTQVDFSFHRIARNALDLYDEVQPGFDKPVAECSYTSQGVPRKVYLYESGETVSGRYPYDESQICRDFRIDVAMAMGSIYGDFRFSEIEVWVALTKALHLSVLSEVRGKWLFVRGKFPSALQTFVAGERTLRIVSNFQNRLTRTLLFCDGIQVGEIFFSIT
jgi:hypothetical protein